MLCKLPNNNLISAGLILLTPTVYRFGGLLKTPCQNFFWLYNSVFI